MLISGIAFGFACALAHAFSYIFSRWFVKASARGATELLAISHIIMAGFSLTILPIFWLHPVAGWSSVFWPVMGATGFYMAGQGAFFVAIKYVTASRASPLLGIKLVFVAFFGMLFFEGTLSYLQWLAVLVAVFSGVLLNYAGGSIRLRALLWLLLTCVGYSLSDLNIQRLIKAVDPEMSMRASIFSVTLVYVFCGFYGLVLLSRLGRVPLDAWKRALPFAISWYAAMCFFYLTISTLGVVLAVILQSMRGLISIGLGAIVAYMGMLHLEHEVKIQDRLRQAAAAILMIVAIGLYLAGK